MTTTEPLTPNHHADHPGFSGIGGLLAALSMTVGRGPVADLACEQAALAPGDRVVDVGCGPGAAVRAAARRSAEVVGVDPAPVMLSVARRLTRRHAPVSFAGGAAEALPVGDGWATVVWSLASVHHWPDLAAGLAEARRALAPGGRLVAVERRTDPGASGLASHGWTDGQAAAFGDLVATAGFCDVDRARHAAGGTEVWVVRARRA